LNEDDSKQVFESVQKYIKLHRYLKYREDEGFYKILKRKKEKMKDHLNNKKVIKVVNKKFKTGSVVRVDIQQHSHGSLLTLDVLGQDGSSQYHNKELFNNMNISFLGKVLEHWLNGFFGKNIDKLNIVNIQDNDIVIEYPKKNDRLYSKQQFIIIKNSSRVAMIEKNEKYPKDNQEGKVIQKPVEIAYGFISRLDHDFISGTITKIKPGQKISIHDQVIFKNYNAVLAAKNPNYKYYKHDLSNYRNKGHLALYKLRNEISADGSTASFSGIQLNAEIYRPSKEIMSFEYSENTSQTSSNISSDSPLISNYRFLFGRTIIPKDIKYIRYLDFMGGLFVDNYSLSALGIPGVKDQSFIGPTLSLKMEHPISRGITIMTGYDFNMSYNIAEAMEYIIKDSENPSGYNLEFGMRYRFKDLPWSIKGLYQIKKNKIKIDDGDSNKILSIQSNNLLIGVSNFF
jgi:hypothetical protein